MGLAAGTAALLATAALHAPVAATTPYLTNRDATFSQSCAMPYKLCHMVYSRAYTKNVLAPASSGFGTGVTAAMTGACLAVGPPGGVACAAFFGVMTGNANAAIAQAAAQNQCADYVADVTDTVGWFETNNGPDCR